MSPLSAFLGGRTVLASTLDDAEWDSLRRAPGLTLRCCNRPAFGRVSHLGTKHFVHHRRGDCSSAPESAEHLQLKDLIVRALARMGISATTEAFCDGWRADVLCENPRRIAFEVQLSPQTNTEWLNRHARYVASGVEGYWFVERYRPTAEVSSVPTLSLFVTHEGSWRASFQGWVLSIDDAVRAAVHNKFRRSPHSIISPGSYSVFFDETYCRKCGEVYMVYSAGRDFHELLSICGRPVQPSPTAAEDLDAELRDQIAAHLARAGVDFSPLAPTRALVNRKSEFFCKECRLAIGFGSTSILPRPKESLPPPLIVKRPALIRPDPHWCLLGTNSPCLEADATTGIAPRWNTWYTAGVATICSRDAGGEWDLGMASDSAMAAQIVESVNAYMQPESAKPSVSPLKEKWELTFNDLEGQQGIGRYGARPAASFRKVLDAELAIRAMVWCGLIEKKGTDLPRRW